MIPRATLKQPSAFLPIAMSLLALGTVLLSVAIHGTAPQTDEGAGAHIWQLLMAAQIPIVLFFTIKWVPQSPRQALPILALQIVAALAAVTPRMICGRFFMRSASMGRWTSPRLRRASSQDSRPVFRRPAAHASLATCTT